MHFNYSDYQGIEFFFKWWEVISNRFSPIEWLLVFSFIVISIYYLVYGNKKERVLLLSETIILTVMVLNPWSAIIMRKFFGSAFDWRVFRYYWLYPMYMQLAYFVTELAFRKKRRVRVIAMWFCLAVMLITGCQQAVSGHYNTLGGHEKFRAVENIYKISNDAVEAADIIEKDKGDKDKEVRVLYEREIGMEIRTYDSSIVTAHNGTYSASIWDRAELSSYVENQDWTGILAAFVSTNSGEDVIGADVLRIALINTSTEYVIIKSESYNVKALEQLGMSCIGKTNSEKYSVYKIEGLDTGDELSWNERLYSPTELRKFGDLYFINDCWQHRIIYSDSLDKPISEWNTLADDILGGHTISSDGSVYVCDDTDNNAVRVYIRNENGFELVQYIENVCYRPHYTYYDDVTGMFYILGANNGELLIFRNENQNLSLVNHLTFDGKIESYTRSFSIIDGYMYIVGNSIYRIDYQNNYDMVNIYELPEEIQGTVGLCKVQDYYYLTIYTDKDFNRNPGFIRTTQLENIINGDYESIYNELGFTGTPYLMTEIDGRYYVAEVDQGNGIVGFDVVDNAICNVNNLYFFRNANMESVVRFYSLYK